MDNNGKNRVISLADMPNDILANILSNLSVKCLLGLKCISKRFNVLISNPDFIERHLSKQQGKDAQILLASQRLMNHIAMDFMVINGEPLFAAKQLVCHYWPSVYDLPDDFYSMSHSCDGILCFYGYIYIHVYNPSTRELRTLPITRSLCYHMHANYYNFDAVSAHREKYCCANKLVAFGRDLFTKEYKILRLFNPRSQHFEEGEILTLNSSPRASWKSIGIVQYKIDTLQRPVYVNGAIYFLTDQTYHKSEVIIIMLDLHMEKFQAIQHPKCCTDPFGPRRSMVLASLRGSLCLAEQTHSELNIWIVEGLYTSIVIWRKLYSTNVLLMELRKSSSFSIEEHKDGTILICGSKGRLYLCDQECKSFNYEIYGIDGEGQFMPTTYIESLVPLYGRLGFE